MTVKAFHHRYLILGAALLFGTCTFSRPAQAGPVAGPTASKELIAEITEKDRIFFDAFFNKCDIETVGKMVTDDFEFYHDKGGLTATSGAQFVESIKGTCERQKTGEDYRARRELVEGSMGVYPLNNYGAIQTGVHRFYRLTEGKGEELVEISRFTVVWKKDDKGWRMARALSYDHKLTE